jgi:hypothetical protein
MKLKILSIVATLMLTSSVLVLASNTNVDLNEDSDQLSLTKEEEDCIQSCTAKYPTNDAAHYSCVKRCLK